MTGYDPVSYHVGSVWPGDNAIIAAGLTRYGFVDEAQRVIVAMLDPVLPKRIERLRVDRIPLAGRLVTVGVDQSSVHVEGLGPDIELVQSPGTR